MLVWWDDYSDKNPALCQPSYKLFRIGQPIDSLAGPCSFSFNEVVQDAPAYPHVQGSKEVGTPDTTSHLGMGKEMQMALVVANRRQYLALCQVPFISSK